MTPGIRQTPVACPAGLCENAANLTKNRAKPDGGSRGTLLALTGSMSPVGRALHERFEHVCRSEVQRLRRKTASLTAAERDSVDALVLEVTRGLATTLDAALATSDSAAIVPAVMRLFAVTAPSLEETT
jgi:Glutamyl-tRNAGlu reductase, dimerisation domain